MGAPGGGGAVGAVGGAGGVGAWGPPVQVTETAKQAPNRAPQALSPGQAQVVPAAVQETDGSAGPPHTTVCCPLIMSALSNPLQTKGGPHQRGQNTPTSGCVTQRAAPLIATAFVDALRPGWAAAAGAAVVGDGATPGLVWAGGAFPAWCLGGCAAEEGERVEELSRCCGGLQDRAGEDGEVEMHLGVVISLFVFTTARKQIFQLSIVMHVHVGGRRRDKACPQIGAWGSWVVGGLGISTASVCWNHGTPWDWLMMLALGGEH